MKKIFLSVKKLLLPLLIIALIPACAYKPEDAGQCKLICGNAIIAASDAVMSIKLKSATVVTECSPADGTAGAQIGPYSSIFLIGENIVDENNAVVGVRPVPNISIEPLLVGKRAPTGSPNDADSRYVGVTTDPSNWCSDSCGIVVMDVTSVCPPIKTSNDLSVQIHSGALFSDPSLYKISTPEN